MTLVSFTKTWGFVRNDRDERGLLQSWRQGLDFLSIAGRWLWFRRNILGYPRLALFFLPKMTDGSGMGYLYAQADVEVSGREEQMERRVRHLVSIQKERIICSIASMPAMRLAIL